LEAVILESKQMAAKINQPSDLWDLECYLTRRRFGGSLYYREIPATLDLANRDGVQGVLREVVG
jgi:hypothetical protein